MTESTKIRGGILDVSWRLAALKQRVLDHERKKKFIQERGHFIRRQSSSRDLNSSSTIKPKSHHSSNSSSNRSSANDDFQEGFQQILYANNASNLQTLYSKLNDITSGYSENETKEFGDNDRDYKSETSSYA